LKFNLTRAALLDKKIAQSSQLIWNMMLGKYLMEKLDQLISYSGSVIAKAKEVVVRFGKVAVLLFSKDGRKSI